MEEKDYSYSRMDRPQTAGRGRKRLQFGGAFQVLLGLLFLGSNTLVLIELGFGYFFGVGFGAGILLILAGAVAVHKSRTSHEPRHKPVKILSIIACILSLGILGIAAMGVYFDMSESEVSARVSSTISMAANIIMAFLGIWGAAISIWMIWQSSTGGVEDSAKNGGFSAGVAGDGDGKCAQSRKSLNGKDKAEYNRKKSNARRKSSMKSVKVVGGAALQRQSKAFDSISMNPDPSMKSGYSDSDLTDDSYDDDEGYDDSDLSDGSDISDETAFDGVDMNDPVAVADAKKRARRRRRRKRYKKFELKKGEKKTTKAIDPFSKDRKIKKTWDKKPKNEFKLTKAQQLRQKKLEEQKAKEAKGKK